MLLKSYRNWNHRNWDEEAFGSLIGKMEELGWVLLLHRLKGKKKEVSPHALFPTKLSVGIHSYGNFPLLFLWAKQLCRNKSFTIPFLQISFAIPSIQRGPKYGTQIRSLAGIVTQLASFSPWKIIRFRHKRFPNCDFLYFIVLPPYLYYLSIL
jgi:hypothetical protein